VPATGWRRRNQSRSMPASRDGLRARCRPSGRCERVVENAARSPFVVVSPDASAKLKLLDRVELLPLHCRAVDSNRMFLRSADGYVLRHEKRGETALCLIVLVAPTGFGRQASLFEIAFEGLAFAA